jgi:hypothetical protein
VELCCLRLLVPDRSQLRELQRISGGGPRLTDTRATATFDCPALTGPSLGSSGLLCGVVCGSMYLMTAGQWVGNGATSAARSFLFLCFCLAGALHRARARGSSRQRHHFRSRSVRSRSCLPHAAGKFHSLPHSCCLTRPRPTVSPRPTTSHAMTRLALPHLLLLAISMALAVNAGPLNVACEDKTSIAYCVRLSSCAHCVLEP